MQEIANTSIVRERKTIQRERTESTMWDVIFTQLSTGLIEHIASPSGSGPEMTAATAAASVTVSAIGPMQSVEEA